MGWNCKAQVLRETGSTKRFRGNRNADRDVHTHMYNHSSTFTFSRRFAVGRRPSPGDHRRCHHHSILGLGTGSTCGRLGHRVFRTHHIPLCPGFARIRRGGVPIIGAQIGRRRHGMPWIFFLTQRVRGLMVNRS